MNIVQNQDVIQPTLSLKSPDNQLVVDLTERFEAIYADIINSYEGNVLENTDDLNEVEFEQMENRFYCLNKTLERLQESFMYMEHTFSC
jgi:hypothetical protein